MEWFARFINEVRDDERGLLFSKDDDTNNTRYYVCDEDESNYYVIRKADTIREKGFCKFNKKFENKLFELYLEVL